MLSEYNRCHFTHRLARQKCSLSSNKSFIRQSLYVTVVRLRTLKHKKSPLFCMCVDERMLKKLKCCQGQTYHISQSHISNFNEQFRFSRAYVYAYVERVTSENCTRQISGFVLLMFPLMLMFMSRLFSLVLMLMLVLML